MNTCQQKPSYEHNIIIYAGCNPSIRSKKLYFYPTRFGWLIPDFSFSYQSKMELDSYKIIRYQKLIGKKNIVSTALHYKTRFKGTPFDKNKKQKQKVLSFICYISRLNSVFVSLGSQWLVSVKGFLVLTEKFFQVHLIFRYFRIICVQQKHKRSIRKALVFYLLFCTMVPQAVFKYMHFETPPYDHPFSNTINSSL